MVMVKTTIVILGQDFEYYGGLTTCFPECTNCTIPSLSKNDLCSPPYYAVHFVVNIKSTSPLSVTSEHLLFGAHFDEL